MSTRAQRLVAEATEQIDTLAGSLATAGEAAPARPCPGRGKLGDGSVGAVAMHTADNYHRVAAFARATASAGPNPHAPGHRAEDVDLRALLGRLEAAKEALAVLGELGDAELDAAPPAGNMRFADGERTLEEVIASVLKHQRHQVDAVAAALATTR